VILSKFETTLLWAGLCFYIYGTAFALAAVRTGNAKSLARARLGALIGAFDHSLVLFSFGARTGRFPVSGAFEALLFLATIVSLLALVLDWYRKLAVLVVGTLPLAGVTTLLAITLVLAPPVAGGPQSVSSAWTVLHVFTAIGSYVAFAIAFVTGILYLVEQRSLKQHASTSILGLMPSLEAVSRVNVRSIAVGAALLAGGIIVGYLRARKEFGTGPEWRVDPKIIVSTVTFGVYSVVLVLSARPGFRGRRTALASVLSFFLVMINFSISLFGSGIHRYR
jgi:ABC-type transport system involved in cytochrome c biogenesis permease subunit